MSQPVGGVLFDLGGTLAAYYHADEFRSVLERCIRSGLEELSRRERAGAEFESVLAAAIALKEAPDFRVRPLAPRLAEIYAVPSHEMHLLDALCVAFLKPIFALGRCFDDTIPVIAQVRATGVRTAIVSNLPWGAPPELWRQELRRLQLHDVVDVTVFCGDVGWRKPAKAIFDHTAALIGVPAAQCVFIGDDPHWDAEGATNAGMRPILIDRDGRHPQAPWPRARTLWEVAERLSLMQNAAS